MIENNSLINLPDGEDGMTDMEKIGKHLKKEDKTDEND